MDQLILSAPMQGWSAPLDEVDDAAFSERMLGDGVAIDPTDGRLLAPCAGHIIHVQATRHAITLRADNGAEILMHIGLETVALKGEGFEVHVADGQAVETGDLLISFDLDAVARGAKSLITPVIVTNGEAFEITTRETGHAVEAGAPLMTLRATGAQAANDTGEAASASRRLAIPFVHGLHARPAARIAAEAKKHTAQVTITAGERQANARSPVALMALGAAHGHNIILTASGPDAETAVAALEALILSGLDEPAAPAHAALKPVPGEPAAPGQLRGVRAAPGLAIGVATRLRAAEVAVAATSRGEAVETAALAAALAAVRASLETAANAGTREQRAILAAHLSFVDDPELAAEAHRRISDGQGAGAAWRAAVNGYIDILKCLADPRMVARVDDLIDLERHVLLALNGETETAQVLPDNAILIADDLLPSRLIALDASKLAGLLIARGGPTSHVAILAAAMNLPAIVAAGSGVLAVAEGATLILDADTGLVTVDPDPGALTAARAAADAVRAR
ncbi:MAG: phosphoenolpyruvate-protein phosphotransferase, partial [Caulobacter sp.]|nr:phosphoenolpyruvate-protein phosphotransferase [Caulobacter sp.]